MKRCLYKIFDTVDSWEYLQPLEYSNLKRKSFAKCSVYKIGTNGKKKIFESSLTNKIMRMKLFFFVYSMFVLVFFQERIYYSRIVTVKKVSTWGKNLYY